jgi:hypothetical protein
VASVSAGASVSVDASVDGAPASSSLPHAAAMSDAAMTPISAVRTREARPAVLFMENPQCRSSPSDDVVSANHEMNYHVN